MKTADHLDNLVEALAEIEHLQWVHWSKAVAPEVAEATRRKWKCCWTDYSKLSDDAKEADRIWSRKVVALLREHKLIPLYESTDLG